MSEVKVINQETFDQEVLKAQEPVIVDFYADWCGPCKALAPKLEEIATEYTGKVKVVKVNVDENRELAAQFGIRGIPAIFYFKDGEISHQLAGNVGKDQLLEPINV